LTDDPDIKLLPLAVVVVGDELGSMFKGLRRVGSVFGVTWPR
jgi:hypothetical protein